MDIPLKVRVPLCIEQGCVYNFFVDFGDNGREAKNRYFVVLNFNPRGDVILLMVTATTQIAKRRAFVKKVGINEKTIVTISKEEYPVFTKESAFDCNDVLEVKIENLIRKIEDGGSMNYSKLNQTLISRLITGVKESPRVREELKKLL